MELVAAIIEKAWGSAALTTKLLALRVSPLTLIVLLTVRDIRERHLLGGLWHSDEKLLRARRLRSVAMTLHEAHKKFSVAVDSSCVLRQACGGLVG
jgi:hypothetical protein